MNSHRSFIYSLLSSIFFHRFLYNFTPVGKGGVRISHVRFSSFKSGYMSWPFIPWNPGSTRQILENGDHRKNQIWRISKQHPSFLRKMLSTLYVEYYWFVSSDFPFVGEFFFIHGKYWKTFWLEMSSPTSLRHSPVKNLVELTPVLRGGEGDLQKTAKVIMLLRGLS